MSGYVSAISAVTALASTAYSVAGSIEQSNTQRQQAEYQADMAKYNAKVAEGNAQIAEAEGRELRKDAYDAATKKRQETAKIIGQQRAKQSASGTQVDVGSNLDLSLDLTERGELDALQLKKQGDWQHYNKQLDAWSNRNQGAIHSSTASKHSAQAAQYSPLLSSGGTILSGLKKSGEDFIKLI